MAWGLVRAEAPRRSDSRGDQLQQAALFEEVRFALDSPLEGSGFEPVWGFSCQVGILVFAGSLFGAGKPFFVPSPAIRFAERAEGVKGSKR
jgi:hypothetical protein